MVTDARPFTRRVVVEPGIMNRSATRGSRMMLRSESVRLLPRRSGSMSVVSSTTRTKPGWSPRGEQSRPSGPLVARTANGETSISARYRGVRCGTSLISDASPG